MRVIKHDGKTARITERDRRELMKRFDPEGLERSDTRAVPCVLCAEHLDGSGCGACPLEVFSLDGESGCLVLVKALTGEMLRLFRYGIRIVNTEGLTNMRNIYDALRTLPRA